MVPTLGGGTQDTDFNKGFTKGMSTKKNRRRNGGSQGDPDPLIVDRQRAWEIEATNATKPRDVSSHLTSTVGTYNKKFYDKKSRPS